MSKANRKADVDGFFFYVVALEWFQRAWPVLSYAGNPETLPEPLGNSNWKEYIGKIDNDELAEGSEQHQPPQTSTRILGRIARKATAARHPQRGIIRCY